MKKRWKRKWICWGLAVLLLIAGGSLQIMAWEVSAEDTSTEALLEESGLEAVAGMTDSAMQSQLDTYGISPTNPESMKNFNLKMVTEMAMQAVRKQITAPFRLFLLFLCVILCAALLQAITTGQNGIFCEMMGVMGAAGASMNALCGCFQSGKTILMHCTDFMTVFTPVFSSMLVSVGQIGTATAYQTAVLLLTTMILQILDKLLLPLLSMCFAIAIADGVSTEGTLGGLLTFTKKLIHWTLGFLMSIFIGVISIQSVVSNGIDSFATKTAKYMVSNFVPIIGGAVSDAYATVLGSLHILKSATGVFGILVLVLMFLPVLVEVVMYRLAISGALALAELFSVKQTAKFLHGAEQVLSMLLAILVSFFVLFLVTIALLLMIGQAS